MYSSFASSSECLHSLNRSNAIVRVDARMRVRVVSSVHGRVLS
jgi:hypothetical protein